MVTKNAERLVKLVNDICADHFIPGAADVLFFSF